MTRKAQLAIEMFTKKGSGSTTLMLKDDMASRGTGGSSIPLTKRLQEVRGRVSGGRIVLEDDQRNAAGDWRRCRGPRAP